MKDIRIRKTVSLSDSEREVLFSLHKQFFRNVNKNLFYSDLAEKEYIIISKENDKPMAFSTIKLHYKNLDGNEILYIFSGDTIVHPCCWQHNILVPAFAAFLKYMMDQNGCREIYWFLITKGYRTYMFMPVFFKNFYPNPDFDTPEAVTKILYHIAHLRFNNHFHEDTGLIYHEGHGDALVEELCVVPESKKKNKYIHFFLRKNPDFALGNELACITRINRENIKPIGLKIIEFKDMIWEI